MWSTHTIYGGPPLFRLWTCHRRGRRILFFPKAIFLVASGRAGKSVIAFDPIVFLMRVGASSSRV